MPTFDPFGLGFVVHLTVSSSLLDRTFAPPSGVTVLVDIIPVE